MTQLEYTRLAQILGNQDRVRQWMIANEELVNGRPSKAPLPELPPIDANQPSVGQPQVTLPPRNAPPEPQSSPFAVSNPAANSSNIYVNPSAMAVGRPQATNPLAVPNATPQSSYDANAADLAQFRAMANDPVGMLYNLRGQELGEFNKRYSALTDKTSAGYRGRSMGNWFNLAAQLMKPSYSFGENLADSLGFLGQSALSRQDKLSALEEKRAEMIQKYNLALAKTAEGLEEKRIAASKPDDLKSIVMGDDFIPRDPISGQPIEVPNPIAYKALEDNPTDENLQNFLVNFPRFRQQAVSAIKRGRMRRGTM